MERRTFLRLGLGGAALVAAPPIFRRDPADAQPAPGPFGHGVASGDPLPDRVILWTRITPSADAMPGSGLGAPTAVTWQVAEDADFRVVVASGQLMTDPARDHTVKVDAAGLRPLTTYLYRFVALGVTSPVGRTRTAPADDADVESLRFGMVSCSNYEGGYFSAYRHVAERDDLDWVLHLGDYVYEYGAGGYGPGAAIGRVHDPAHEMVSLEDYRRRHALYKTDPDLRALHARYAFIATIDDHEVTDNSWADGAVNHQGAEGDYRERRARAFQAYFEWMPIRTTGGDDEPTRIWRRLRFGQLADLFMLDERTYRSAQLEGLAGDLFVTSTERDDPDRTMLGDEQKAFLEDGLRGSDATWKLLGNGVMFAPLVLVDLPNLVGGLLDPLGLPVGVPVALNADQWDGYRAEQRALTELFAEVGGVVVLTGDIHSSWASELPTDPGVYLPAVGGPSAGIEFVTPAITSDSFTAAIASAGLPNAEQVARLLPIAIGTAAPWFKFVDPDHHGFGILEVTRSHAQYDWHFVSDRTDPNAEEAFAIAYRSLVGTNKLHQATVLPHRSVPGPVPATSGAPGSPSAPTGGGPGAAGGSGGSGGTGGTGAGSLPATGVDAGVPSAIAAGAAALAIALAAAGRRAAVGQDGAP